MMKPKSGHPLTKVPRTIQTLSSVNPLGSFASATLGSLLFLKPSAVYLVSSQICTLCSFISMSACAHRQLSEIFPSHLFQITAPRPPEILSPFSVLSFCMAFNTFRKLPDLIRTRIQVPCRKRTRHWESRHWSNIIYLMNTTIFFKSAAIKCSNF